MRAWWPRRLGVQLPLTVALALWLAIGSFGAYTVQQQAAAALRDIEHEAATLARNIALAGEGPILTDRLDVVDELLLRGLDFPGVREIAVFDADGASLGRAVHEPGQAPRTVFGLPGTRTALPTASGAHIVLAPARGRVTAWQPIVGGGLIGWVRVDRDTDELQSMRRETLLSTAVACLLAGSFSAVGLAIWLRRPLRQIERARDFAIGLERIDGQRLDVGRGPDETLALGHALNQASARLAAQRSAIEDGITALAESNEQLGTIFTLSPDALLSFDGDGRLKHANAAFERITGIEVADVLEQPGARLQARLRERFADAGDRFTLDACFPAAGDADAAPRRQRLTLSQPRLTVIDLVGLNTASASLKRLLCIRDVTRESEVERLKGRFLSTAAHELRTPVTTIYGCAELLAASDFDAGQRREMHEMMRRQGRVLLGLVNALLDLSRIEAQGGRGLRLEALALPEALAACSRDFQPPPGREAPQWQPGQSGITVLADAARLTQVLDNLLSNAYKYSHGGKVQLRLLAATRAGGAGVCGFEVSDQGIGMSAAEVARVGERFYRADASGHVPGTGLGMSIVQELVALMGGRLHIASTPGLGTTVQVWLRAAAGTPANAPRLERETV